MAEFKLLFELLIKLLPVLLERLLVPVVLLISEQFFEVPLGQDPARVVPIAAIFLPLSRLVGRRSSTNVLRRVQLMMLLTLLVLLRVFVPHGPLIELCAKSLLLLLLGQKAVLFLAVQLLQVNLHLRKHWLLTMMELVGMLPASVQHLLVFLALIEVKEQALFV